MADLGTPEQGSTTEAVLDVAQRLVQTRGYNGFSYKDIALALGIRTASIHYHFPTKTDLGVKLASRYRDRFMASLAEIADSETDAMRRLVRFGGLFRSTFEVESRLCLCGMMSAEIATLPEPVAAEVERFFRAMEAWLATVLEAGRRAKRVAFAGPARRQARQLIATLEGAMIVARGLRESDHFQAIVDGCLAQLRRRELVTA
jgi:TetR/AcrR family transcriptional repressor of nem operon